METRAHYVAVGAFVLAVIFLAFVAVLWLGRSEFAQDTKRYYIYFRGSVMGLNKGSQVQYNGIPVGRVIDIRVDPHNLAQIQVTVEIDTSIVNIKSDAEAFLETNILNGIATVQIRGGTQEASEEVADVVNNANKAVIELRSFFRNIEQSYVEKGGLKDQLSQTLGDADRLAKNLTDASRQIQTLIQENRPGIRGFTHNSLNQLGDLVTDLKRFVASMGRFAAEIERNPPMLLFGDRRQGYRPQ